jgi:intracellular sulfur oxidation DsrE/DsrF family protein
MQSHSTSSFSWLARLFVAVVALSAFSCYAQIAQAAGKQGFVFQVSDNDPAKWNLALNNAKNVQQELGKDNVDIEIVAYGPGLNMLKFDSPVGNRLEEAAEAGVHLYACGNTMKGMKLTKEDLHPGVEVVKAGVIEIAAKQRQGYSYIRP